MNRIPVASDVVIFLHIPKCAGSSFGSIFDKVFRPINRFFWHGHDGDVNILANTDCFYRSDSESSLKFIGGHFTFGTANKIILGAGLSEATICTIIRDPIQQAYSYYKWLTQKPHSERKMHPLYDECKGLTPHQFFRNRNALMEAVNIQTRYILDMDYLYEFSQTNIHAYLDNVIDKKNILIVDEQGVNLLINDLFGRSPEFTGLKYDFNLTRENVTSKHDGSWHEFDTQLVREIYWADIILFNKINPTFSDRKTSDFVSEYVGSSFQLLTQCGKRQGAQMVANGAAGFLIFGPFVALPKGSYKAVLSVGASNLFPDTYLDIVYCGGTVCLKKVTLTDLSVETIVTVPFELDAACVDLQIRLWVPAGTDSVVNFLRIALDDRSVITASLGDPKREIKVGANESTESQAPVRSQELADQVEVVQIADGPMRIFKGDAVIGAALKSTGAFETEKIDEVSAFLRERFVFTSELFVDIGANIGTHTVHALKSGGFKRGLAFEPDPANYALLTQNISEAGLSDKVKAFKLALSSRSGAATFELCGSNFGDHRVRVAGVQPSMTFDENNRRPISVITDTGDEFFEENDLALSSETLIWVDTQGHGGHVFTGLGKLLAGAERPFVVCEFWPYGLERAGGKEMFFDFMRSCKVFYDINQPNWQKHPQIKLEKLESMYQLLLSDTRDGHYPHSDLLCIL